MGLKCASRLALRRGFSQVRRSDAGMTQPSSPRSLFPSTPFSPPGQGRSSYCLYEIPFSSLAVPIYCTSYPRGSVAKRFPIAIEIGVVAVFERRHDDGEPRIIRCEAGGEFVQLLPGRKPAPYSFSYFALCQDQEPLSLRGWNFHGDTGCQPNVACGKLDRDWCHRFNQQRSPPQLRRRDFLSCMGTGGCMNRIWSVQNSFHPGSPLRLGGSHE